MAASPMAWLQEWPNRSAGSRAEGGEMPHTCSGQRITFKERNGENEGLQKCLVGRRTFMGDGAVSRFELCLLRSGIRICISEERGKDRDREKRGRLNAVCLSLLWWRLCIHQISN